jgi:hypothetical protein
VSSTFSSLLLAVAVVLAPRMAEACAVCSPNAGDPSGPAFARAALFLSLVPLFMLGGIGWYLWRRARQIAADEAAGVTRLPGRHERPPAPDPSLRERLSPARRPRQRQPVGG